MATATAGCRLNPLRSVMPLVTGSVPLQHAVVLLAATHRQQPALQLMTLKSKALKSFAEELLYLDGMTKLAVILVLLFTDFVHNGQSSWFAHLSAVGKIMQSIHDDRKSHWRLQEDSYRAMVLQFYCFDIMNALLSVKPPILPAKYLKDALRINREHARSTLDDVTFEAFGFTEQMLLVLSRIVRAHDHSIDDVQDLYVPDVDSLIDDGWMPDDAEERVHVEEIWKHAIIVYLMTRRSPYRWPRQAFDVHVQQVFAHASSLPPSSVQRRRILFPLLFVGSDTHYSERRAFLQRYCVSCFEVTGLGVFHMGLGILRQVWELRSREEEERKVLGGRAYSCWRNVTTGTGTLFVHAD